MKGRTIGHYLHTFGLHTSHLSVKFKVTANITANANYKPNIFQSNQIKSFLLQLLQQKMKLSPYGLFDVDLGLFSMVRVRIRRLEQFLSQVLQITGAVTTYILILIQFDVSQKTENP